MSYALAWPGRLAPVGGLWRADLKEGEVLSQFALALQAALHTALGRRPEVVRLAWPRGCQGLLAELDEADEEGTAAEELVREALSGYRGAWPPRREDLEAAFPALLERARRGRGG